MGGSGNDARFNGPSGVDVDSTGNIYVSDTGNNTIRKVTPEGVVTTLGGMLQLQGATGENVIGRSIDGMGSATRFNHPVGIAVDCFGNLYIVDVYNNTIRKGYPALVILHSGPGFGVNLDGSGFGFNLTELPGRSVVVDASSDLLSWLPIWTNTFSGTLHFSDPQSGKSSQRFYRMRTR